MSRSRIGLVAMAAGLLLAACGAADDPAGEASTTSAPTAATSGPTVEASHTVATVEEFAALLDDPGVLVVNVHVPYEGELPGTDALVSYDRIREWDGLPQDHDAALAVYCMSGNMSWQAAQALVEDGYTDVRELDGGMLAWEDLGRELVTRDASARPQG